MTGRSLRNLRTALTKLKNKKEISKNQKFQERQNGCQCDDMISSVAEDYIRNVVPKLQKPAPFFKGQALVKGEFKDISLDLYKGRYLVLFFYPMDFTFVCPTEIIAFSDRIADFEALYTDVIGCSTDSVYSHFAWCQQPRKEGGLGDMKIPLLADKNMQISRDYGVLDEDTGIAFRGLFIIDKRAHLRQIIVNDLPIGRDVDEVLRLVQAIKFTDENGEVCPVNWKPGAKTLQPTADGLKKFVNT
ncbi:peroxiredoxin 2-like [Onthophagus taurus]|uniref:peroxiredoxin 2-like n=1 Tax=Onthophagus taurus TaxID=166361 RepID=UPI000C20293C|nr:peroxiredoxin 1-like [Onthophagus taurus]XP_022904048.1 peroxiredoxin 1-like [Onthophagus taurus]